MNTTHELYSFFAIVLLLVLINLIVDIGQDYLEDWQDRVAVVASFAELYDGDKTLEFYGPSYDQMTLEAFLDFWVLLTDEQKDNYIGYSWDNQPFAEQ
jgi:hypothetical protein